MRKVIGLSVCALLSVACSQDHFDPSKEDSGDNTNVVGGGDGGTTPEASIPPGCDGTKLPTDNECVVNDAEGVFASSSLGTATGDGTQAHPLASLDAAIALAKKSNKTRVYACAETYGEQIHIENGIDVFGYFTTCSPTAWHVSPTHAKVLAPASPAASATNVTSPTRFEAVDLVAPSYTDKSQSSIGLVASASPGLRVANATIHAGTGGRGNDGANATAPTDSGSAKNGQVGQQGHVCGGVLCAPNYGALGGTNACTGATLLPAAGGAGGSGGQFKRSSDNIQWNPVSGMPTTAGNPTTPTSLSAAGGAIAGAGNNGMAGATGTDGHPGTIGVFSANGYVAANGTMGTDGEPGQSGGGAGGMDINAISQSGWTLKADEYAWSEGGAGGGAGGCGGIAAQIGGGGGGSVAIIAIQSGFTLDHVSLETSAAGDGGAAGRPSLPSAGGAGGQPSQAGKAAGNGAMGGRAGVSGNGAGGPSIGIAYQGAKPTLLATTPIVGAAGHGVAARAFTDGTLIPASPDGVSSNDYAF